MEHLQHFGFSLDPFQIEPDLRFYYDSALHCEAQRRVERGLRQSKGLTVFTGEGGTGKSLLARRLLGGLEEEVFEVALMVMLPGAVQGRSLVTRFAKHLEVEDLSDDPSQVMGQLYEQLAMVREDGRHAVLILDDAHLLGEQALAEVGSLLSLEYEERRLVSILLVGLEELEDSVAADRSLGQRVDIRVRVTSLDLEDSKAYLANRLVVAGGDPAILPGEAVEALFKHGRGRPRLMNTLADNALFEAYLAGRKHVDASDVERAAGDLGIGLEPASTGLQGSASPVDSSAPTPVIAESPIPLKAPMEAPLTHSAEGDDDLDLASFLTSAQAAPELETELPSEELSLDMEIGDASQEFEFAGGAGETSLVLDDDSEIALGDEISAIELSEAMASDDELGEQVGDPVLDLEIEDEGQPDRELGDVAEATRLMLPTDDVVLPTAEDGLEVDALEGLDALDALDADPAAGDDDNDEIEALFDQLLDD